MQILSSKKWCAIFALMLVLMISSGCEARPVLDDGEADIYQRLHHKFSRMTSYTATATVTVSSNKTENVYVMQQQVMLPDKASMTLTEPASLQGLRRVYRDGQVTIQDAGAETPLTVPAASDFDDILVNAFFSLYYQSEDTAVSVDAGAGEAGTLLLETAAVPETAGRYKMTLLVDTKKLEPKVLTVYDVGGNVRTRAEFSEFCYNPTIDDSVFAIE